MMQMKNEQVVDVKKEASFASDTSDRSMMDWAKALLLLVVGLTIAHLGVTLFLLSNLGTDTFTVFIQGLSRQLELSVGTVHVIILCALMGIMLITTKGYIKPGTVVCAFLGGPIIDLFTWLLGGIINAQNPILIRYIVMISGCVILALGMSIVISSNAGTGPNDLIAIILTDRLKRFEFRWVRVSCDVVYIIAGFLLGGTVGAGTVVAALLTGPTVQFWLPKSRKVVDMFLQQMK